MGRFESTATTYAAYREPYPPEFFAAAAESLGLTGRESLIDLGTGPGLLALGFAPFVARIVGVDPEPAMVAEASRAAAEAGRPFDVILGRAEDVDLGAFDLITIGRALHWMEREPTLAALERLLAPGGRILVCGARSDDANPWRAAFEQVSRAWSGVDQPRHRHVHQHFFDGSGFVAQGEASVEHRHAVELDDIAERALTRSSTSPAALGDRIETFRAEMRQALAPFFRDGPTEEIITASARIFGRAPLRAGGVRTRAATREDLPRIHEVRHGTLENRLTDPSLVTDEEVAWYMDHGVFLVGEDDSGVQGFTCANPQTGYIWALFVIEGRHGEGFGTALLDAAMRRLREAGHRQSYLTTGPGTKAEGFYASRGWRAMGDNLHGDPVYRLWL